MRIMRLAAAFLAMSLLVVILPWIARADVSNSDAALKFFYQGAGALSPAFSPEITEYTVHMRSSELGYYTAAIPSNADAALAYSMNGGPWTPIGNYASTGYLPTQRGNNTFQFKVTSSDNSTSKIYTVQVYYPNTNDANLWDLSVSPGSISPAFNPSTTAYTLNVPYTTSSLDVNALANDLAAAVSIAGNSAQGGISSSVPLNVGSNMVYIAVKSYDASVTKTYSITVTRALPSANADLSALSVPGNSLSPAFQSGVTSYALQDVGYDTGTIAVTPTASDSTAVLSIQNSQGGYDPIPSGSLSAPLALRPGDNTIVIKVTAQDGITEKLYSLNVYRKSNNALLSQLAVLPGGLNESFDSHVFTYTLADITTDSLTVTPTLADTKGSVQISVNNGSYAPVSNGQEATVPLAAGTHTIHVKVSAEDTGYTNVYHLTVKRVQDSTISPVSGTFDKYALNTAEGQYHDVATVLNLNGNLLTGLKLGTAVLDNAAYTLSGSTLTLHKEYLSTLAAGEHEFELVMDAGSHPLFTVAVKDTTPPVMAAPTAGDAAVTLKWAPVSGATGYKVFASTVPGTYGTALATLGPAADSYSAAGLTNGTTYYFVVKAVNGGGDSAASAEVSATPQAPAPGAPVVQAVTAGDGQVHLVWAPVSGATGYNVYTSTTSGEYGAAAGTVAAAVYSYDAVGLTNGTTYYFVVKAVNGGGDSAASAEVSATPQVPAPGAPVLQTAVPGNGTVSLNWEPAAGASGYTVYQSTVPGTYDQPAGTVAGSVYSYTAAGLINGTTYYFTVKAANPGGGSALSNEVSATPRTVPAAPAILSTTAGDGQVTVAFAAPADNGGSSVTSYEITASPGGSVTTASASPVTVTGLVNGTAYTFTVKAKNGAGAGPASDPSNAVIPMAPASGEGYPAEPAPPVTSRVPAAPAKEAPAPEVLTYVNGKIEDLGAMSTVLADNRRHSIVTLDQGKLDRILAEHQPGAKISVEFNNLSEVQTVELNGLLLQHLQQKEATISVHTPKAAYTIPLQLIRWDTAGQPGTNASAADVRIQIEIAAPDASLAGTARTAAAKGGFTFLAGPLDFSVKIVSGSQTSGLAGFSAYVQRSFSLPAGTDTSRATGIVMEPDGTVRHVPTRFVLQNGEYAAVISSLTNSTYAIVSHPVEFKDMAGHWAQAAVDDLGARWVVNGSGNGFFLPDRGITRAEFAAVLVRGLGLQAAGGTSPFTDVSSSDWYSSAVQTASRHQLITGFEDGSFRPDDAITREQAMTMLAQAMRLTGFASEVSISPADLMKKFTDADQASAWALDSIAASLEAGLITGRSGTGLAPQSHVTRAEVAVLLQRLLKKSGLI
ncbi:cadherin-like beta sandwich domain-containing protein [Paenibacillus riograndensis]|uniref:cadherin-like beta sandwich domain-containing protein n=1 Tax=Paenibacillus riograndensis TaxID=483937 RepID=UPI000764BFFD|nr:cadherin-like beta sandwich domain-containing protein [Paenibacillus riograndensis]